MQSENLWSETDYLHGYCTPSQIGTVIDHSIWSLRDYQERVCTAEQIGRPKHPTPLVQEVQEVQGPKKTYAEKLQELSEQAVDAVLDHPGGAKAWFKENPSAHVKVLVKLATPQVQVPDVNLSVEVSWLSPERLSYKQGNVVDISGPIEDAKVLEALGTTPLSDQSSGTESPPPTTSGAWKPVEPPVTGMNTLIHSIKDAK